MIHNFHTLKQKQVYLKALITPGTQFSLRAKKRVCSICVFRVWTLWSRSTSRITTLTLSILFYMNECNILLETWRKCSMNHFSNTPHVSTASLLHFSASSTDLLPHSLRPEPPDFTHSLIYVGHTFRICSASANLFVPVLSCYREDTVRSLTDWLGLVGYLFCLRKPGL